MPRNGSGVYSLPANTFNPAVTGTDIDADDWNEAADDLETALSGSLSADGQTTATQPIPFAQGVVTNTVAERTSGSGVTIDSVLLKDGRVDWTKGADVTAATTPDITSITGNVVVITGNTTIEGFAMATAGITRLVKFTGTPQLTHNGASFILPSGANITCAAGDTAIFVSLGSGNWQCWLFQRASGAAVNGAPTDAQYVTLATSGGLSNERVLTAGRGVTLADGGAGSAVTVAVDPSFFLGFISGLTVSNDGSDATNDIDIATGVATDSTGACIMKLASALVKRLDANWAAGTNQGGRYSGEGLTDKTYHVYLVAKALGADADIYIDPSASEATVLGHLQAETGGGSYLYVRRIWSIIRLSSAIRAFSQFGDECIWNAITEDFDSTVGTTASSITLNTPGGIKTIAVIRAMTSSAMTEGIILSSLDASDQAPIVTYNSLPAYDLTGLTVNGTTRHIRTNTASQIRARASAATQALAIYCIGYIDLRGRG